MIKARNSTGGGDLAGAGGRDAWPRATSAIGEPFDIVIAHGRVRVVVPWHASIDRQQICGEIADATAVRLLQVPRSPGR